MGTDMGLAPRHRDTPSPLSVRSRLEMLEANGWRHEEKLETQDSCFKPQPSNLKPLMGDYVDAR